MVRSAKLRNIRDFVPLPENVRAVAPARHLLPIEALHMMKFP